jgi:hypothetical protein
MVSPAFPALRNLTASFRLFMSVMAMMWLVFIIALGTPRAVVQLRSYHVHRRDQLRERPDADFAIALKILPDVESPPPPPAIHSDSALIDVMDVDGIAVVVTPGASRLAIDSLTRVIDPARRDSSILIVVIGYHDNWFPEVRKKPFDTQQRLATLRQVVSRLHPDIVLPAEDPYGSGERAVGTRSVEQWKAYLSEAARVAKSVDRNVRVGVSASSYRTTDSALYAWAAGPRSPIDVVGFSFFPSPYIGGGIQSDTRTAGSLDASHAVAKGSLDLRDRRIPARVWRPQPGRSNLASAGLGHRSPRDQGRCRVRGRRLRAVARAARAEWTLPARDRPSSVAPSNNCANRRDESTVNRRDFLFRSDSRRCTLLHHPEYLARYAESHVRRRPVSARCRVRRSDADWWRALDAARSSVRSSRMAEWAARVRS